MLKRTKRGIVPYDPRLKDRARQLRKTQTDAEEVLWQQVLRNRQLLGYKFLRQKPVQFFILDFYCSKLLLGIELDGGIHDNRKEYDRDRTYILNSLGIKVIRYKNHDILNRLGDVIKSIEKQIEIRRKEIKYE